jgi:tryptophanyl-tRNA synthetase
MSKSLDNHIELAATPKETISRIKTMFTDPARVTRDIPGNPDICNVFSMHKIFSKPEEIEMVNTECRRAGIGCVDCKKIYAKNLNENLEPFRQRREEFARKPDQVWAILDDGAKRASEVAKKTMAEVRAAIGLP